MARILALYGATMNTGVSQRFQLAPAEPTEHALELLAGAQGDQVVELQVVMQNQPFAISMFVRPSLWGAWTVWETEEGATP